jgi:hemerythrin-like domain-containing protein
MESLVDNLHRIHRVITRALAVALAHGENFAREGFADETSRRGFVDYARCLVLLLRAHHEGEEEMLFPRLVGGTSGGNLAELEAQHRELVAALHDAVAATDRAEAGEPPREWLGELVTALAIIEPRWAAHVELEQKTVTQAVLDGLMGADDQMALLRALAEHGQKNGHVPPLAVAFLVYNLEPADRAALQRLMPSQVTNELMPGPWRTQWSTMQRFLLE